MSSVFIFLHPIFQFKKNVIMAVEMIKSNVHTITSTAGHYSKKKKKNSYLSTRSNVSNLLGSVTKLQNYSQALMKQPTCEQNYSVVNAIGRDY